MFVNCNLIIGCGENEKINYEVLLKGDIILTTSNESIGKIVRGGTKSDISHAMLYVANGTVMDSTSDGVHSKNLQKIFYEDNCSIYALRLIDTLDDLVIEKVVAYVRARTGAPYSVKEAVISATERKKQGGSERQFCSRLVARAYADAGIYLHENPDFCTPDHLKNSSLLRVVANSSVAVSDIEIQAMKRHGDATKGMKEATQNVLNQARKLCPGVLQLNDINQVVIERPELDTGMANAFLQSGYLEYWRTDEEKYPWRYAIDEMYAMHEDCEKKGSLDSLIKYCDDTLNDVKDGTFKHWHINAAAFADLFKKYPRKTLGLLADLYATLADQNNRKVEVARQWKEETGY